MCTLIVFKEMRPTKPLVVAANRDEVADRPTRDPHWRTPGIFAPLDLVHDGSWIGINRQGLVVALTNRWPVKRVKGRRSRGLIVTEALERPSVRGATMSLISRPADTYNGFHLLLADGQEAVLIWNDGEEYQMSELGSGFHIITGNGFEPGHSNRDLMIRGFLLGHGDDLPEPIFVRNDLLSFHGPGPEDGTCVHGEGVRMESVSSMVITHKGKGLWAEAHWRTGRPCERGPWQKEAIDFRRE
ncbi:MAG: NRDE family protein [Patescibacteria group bacterium]|nr:NRDE family protein [Patescibacteria group bacterium]